MNRTHFWTQRVVDQITVEAARRGDREAQARLLRELQDPWFRFCVSLLGNADDARDAVQETALRFLRDLSRFRGNSSITTWSMGIAINVTREMRRKRSRTMLSITSETEDGESGGDQPPEDKKSESPDDQAAQRQSSQILRSMLKDLPERQREAVVLRYFQELSVEETATAMNCAVGTVKATVHQALRALRTRMEQMA
jgi:RNA polymerase sigma-70 factor (ECF subfamily)